jgi:hypothetical protein
MASNTRWRNGPYQIQTDPTGTHVSLNRASYERHGVWYGYNNLIHAHVDSFEAAAAMAVRVEIAINGKAA